MLRIHWQLTTANSSCSTAQTTDNQLVAVLRSSSTHPEGSSEHELRRILRIQVPVIVKLAERKLALSEVMRLGVGAIIEFVKSSEEPLELLINNKVIGTGEAVKVGENFGLRMKHIGEVKHVIASMVTPER